MPELRYGAGGIESLHSVSGLHSCIRICIERAVN